MTKVDFGGLKQKLVTSIVAISAIQVLKAFMNIEQYDTSKLGWLVGIHVLFLGSLLAVVLADRISAPTEHPIENGARPRVERGLEALRNSNFLPAVPRCGAAVRLC